MSEFGAKYNCPLTKGGCFAYSDTACIKGCAVAEAIAAEREACARIAETVQEPAEDGEYWIARQIAAAIRGRTAT